MASDYIHIIVYQCNITLLLQSSKLTRSCWKLFVWRTNSVDSKWNILQMSGHCLGSGRVPSRQPASINFAYQFWNLDVSNHSGCSLRVKCLQQASTRAKHLEIGSVSIKSFFFVLFWFYCTLDSLVMVILSLSCNCFCMALNELIFISHQIIFSPKKRNLTLEFRPSFI